MVVNYVKNQSVEDLEYASKLRFDIFIAHFINQQFQINNRSSTHHPD